MQRDNRELLALGAVSVLTAGALWWARSRLNTRVIPRSTLVNPGAVAGIATSLPQGLDPFILASWEFAGGEIAYAPYGSTLRFKKDTLSCTKCLLPSETLKKGSGNCVAKSGLLVSLLRNRLPPENVYMALGLLALEGMGGHAWVIVQRGSKWYVLESTLPPPRCPWVEAADLSEVYIPQAFVNDRDLTCYDSDICHIKGSCPCRLDKLISAY